MKNPLLLALTKEERNLVKGLSIKKDVTLFHEDDFCDSIGIVVSGSLSIVSYTDNGATINFGDLSVGSVFGANLVFSSNPVYKGDVIAKEKSIVGMIKKDNLLKIIHDNPKFLELFLTIQADAAKALNAKIKMLSYDSAEDRFFFYLHDCGGKIEFKSVTALAETLHLQRETLSRLLTKLEKDKKIKRENKLIVSMKKGLRLK